MGIRESSSQDDAYDRDLLELYLRAAMIAKTGTGVHSEIKIISYLDQYGLTGAMIDNIGINKLCCPGCDALIRSYKHPRILVHGNHGKWYPSPLKCSTSQFPTKEQLLCVRKEILEDFVEDLGEYRRRKSATPGNQSR